MPARRLNEREYDAYMSWLESLRDACEADATSPATGGKLAWREHYTRLAITYEMCRHRAATITDPPTKV